MRRAILVAALGFLITFVVRLPARVAVALLPQSIRCDGAAGTLWSGSCAQLDTGSMSLSEVSWRLHPWALLALRLTADVEVADPRTNGRAILTVTPTGELTAHTLTAHVDWQRPLLGVPVTGLLQLDLPAARIHNGHLASIQGTIELQQARLRSPPTALGRYELTLAPGAENGLTLGQLRDLGGPLSVQGQLRLHENGSYDVHGSVAAAGTSASPDLERVLALLGPADAQGRHPITVSGTL